MRKVEYVFPWDRREESILEQSKPRWVSAIAGILAAAGSAYAAEKSAAAQKKNAAVAANSANQAQGGSGGGYQPSALGLSKDPSLLDPNGGGGAADFFKSLQRQDEQPNQDQMSLGLEPSMFHTENQAPAAADTQQPAPQQKTVPYTQYAQLAGQVAQLFMPKPVEPSPIPQAGPSNYTPSAYQFARRQGGF